jgi:hypothetical protein
MKHENYLYRKNQLMRALDKSLAYVKPTIFSWLGETQANQFIRDTRQEYEALLPRIPFVGTNALSLSFFIPTTRYLAMYRALQKQGRTVEDAGRLAYLIGTEETMAVPLIIRRFMEYLWFSPLVTRWGRKQTLRRQKRPYPGGSVMVYVPGDGQEFDYGIDYTECAVCKFLQAENAFELAPYSCAIDKPVSELLGWGLTRTETIAAGFPTCSFRFKKGGATNVPIPQALLAPLGTNI